MKHTRKGNFFSLPNEVFLLGLSPGELAVYSYLRRCESRKTHQCWPSYKTIGEAVGMSENTVRKYTLRLEERGLITTEPTEVTTRNGQKRNGNLLYTILPIQEVINHSYISLMMPASMIPSLESSGWSTPPTMETTMHPTVWAKNI